MDSHIVDLQQPSYQLNNKLAELLERNDVKRVGLSANGDIKVPLNKASSPETSETFILQEAGIIFHKHVMAFATSDSNLDGIFCA